MASILDLDADISSDENDDDYLPPNGVVSDSSGDNDSFDEDEKVSEQNTKCPKAKRNPQKSKDPESEIKPEVPAVDEKKRAESIWLDFLSDVSKPPEKRPTISETKDVPKTNSIDSKPANSEKASVEQLFEFAGETFTLNGEVCSPITESIEKTNTTQINGGVSEIATTPVMPKKRGGLESVLDSISGKKKKLSTLEKTLFDWKTFKRAQGIEQELEQYNRGKQGYIERQRFLQRSDVRSFEVEKAARLSKRRMP